MFNLDYALSIGGWDTKDHKQVVNNHANEPGTLDFI